MVQLSNKPVMSVVIPAYNEADSIASCVEAICKTLDQENIPFEIVLVDDHSSDNTAQAINQLILLDSRVRFVANDYPKGFGFAVRKGLDSFNGDMVSIVMADSSDEPGDIVVYYRKMLAGCDCVFGTRFSRKSKVTGYPLHKLFLNRLGNWFISLLFWIRYDDVTNAFKCYSRQTIDGLRPFLSCTFNLTAELPLKAIARGYSWCVVPINWYGRKKGVSKWKIKELGSRYMFILFYAWLEKNLSKGDYSKGKYLEDHK